MKKLILISYCAIAAVSILLLPEVAAAQRRVVVRRPVVVKRPIVRTRVFVRPGHPLRRGLPATVVVRPARRVVTVGAPAVFLPSVVWVPATAVVPSPDRLTWQDSESIVKEEGWVDANFGIDMRGNALFLQIDGKTKLNFAEVYFANGNVQVIDFNEKTRETGTYRLLDFNDGRHVSTVRILARSESDETTLSVLLGN